MNSSQIASLVEVGIPLIIGVLLLAAPSLFVKKRSDEAAYLKAKKTLKKCGFGLLAAAALLLAANADQLFKSQTKSTESFLATIVDQNNRILPKQVDEFTTLERVSASGNTFLFHYKLQNLDVDVGELSVEAASDALKPTLIKQLRSLKSADELRARGIHVHHVYATADGAKTFTVKIAPSEY